MGAQPQLPITSDFLTIGWVTQSTQYPPNRDSCATSILFLDLFVLKLSVIIHRNQNRLVRPTDLVQGRAYKIINVGNNTPLYASDGIFFSSRPSSPRFLFLPSFSCPFTELSSEGLLYTGNGGKNNVWVLIDQTASGTSIIANIKGGVCTFPSLPPPPPFFARLTLSAPSIAAQFHSIFLSKEWMFRFTKIQVKLRFSIFVKIELK